MERLHPWPPFLQSEPTKAGTFVAGTLSRFTQGCEPCGRPVHEMRALPGSPPSPRPRSGRGTGTLHVSISAEQVASFLSWISKSLWYPPTNIACGHGHVLAQLGWTGMIRLLLSLWKRGLGSEGHGNALWGLSSVGTPDWGPLERSKMGVAPRTRSHKAGESREGRGWASGDPEARPGHVPPQPGVKAAPVLSVPRVPICEQGMVPNGCQRGAETRGLPVRPWTGET